LTRTSLDPTSLYPMNRDLFGAVRDALATLTEHTGQGADTLFGERPLEPEQMAPAAAHAMGIIEGAGIALGLTALEGLDEIEAERARRR
jgi:hypothetical protein